MASTIKVDNVQNQPGTNIVSKCGTDVTIGASGDTVALASGASQSGFGRTGTVDWDTASIKTTTFTAVSGKGYFCNTTGGAITVNLPAGSAGDIVGLKDYANTWDSYGVTVAPNGSDNIGGGSAVDPVLETEGGSVLLVYVDGTQGWLTTQESVTINPSGIETFMAGCGGTPTTSGDYKIHTFTGPGTFTVCSIGTPADNNIVSYMVVAGGAGGGGSEGGGGGGAGGFREYKAPNDTYTASPLNGNPGGTAVTVTATPYPIVIGGGGAAGLGCNPDPVMRGQPGDVSTFSTITATGGGGGGAHSNPNPGQPGGSGGGSGARFNVAGGCGNTPSTSPAQGTDGGNAAPSPTPSGVDAGGGGGGATVAGGDAADFAAAAGGAGATTSISATPTAYGGGGGGGQEGGAPFVGCGGAGGGARGGCSGSPQGAQGTINTGGGGGGSATNSPGNAGAGGSGIVIIRYKFQ